jgi:hypothetical protein
MRSVTAQHIPPNSAPIPKLFSASRSIEPIPSRGSTKPGTCSSLPKLVTCRRLLEREFRDLHHSINHRFERVSARLETIEARIEVFSRRTDDEVEQRHKLAERLSNIERSV